MSDSLARVVGAGQLRQDPGEDLDGVPVVSVVQPKDAAEVAACLVAAREEQLAVVPSGGGSKLGWGNPCRAEGFVRLDLSALDAPLNVQPDEGIATLAAGAPVADVERAARSCGMQTRLDASFPRATVGGTIAADPQGPESGLGRRLRDDLLGLEVALPNGTLTSCGGRVVKNVTGFDLVRLYCGSLGSLGVITRATVRVRPLPAAERVLSRPCADEAEACALASELVSARVDPAGAVIVPDRDGVALVWRIEGIEAEVAARAERVPGEGVERAHWDALLARCADVGAPDLATVRLRLAARPSETVVLCRTLAELGGAGALELALPASGRVYASMPAERTADLLQHCARAHWLIVLERAAPELKRQYDVFGPEPEGIGLMRAVKRRFDPDGVLSPGRFVGRI